MEPVQFRSTRKFLSELHKAFCKRGTRRPFKVKKGIAGKDVAATTKDRLLSLPHGVRATLGAAVLVN